MLRFWSIITVGVFFMIYKTLQIQLPTQSYPVYIGPSLLKQPELFERHLQGKQVMIVTQQRVADFYLKDLLATLSAYRCTVALLPQGERYKNLNTWRKLIDHLVAHGHERSTTIVALGGGMVGDMAGFAAACYLRGVGYIQIPTTLVAQVDSAIGGKTGINHACGKNLMGIFYHPLCVIADSTTLKTLARREFIAGLAEVIKYSLIRDPFFFSWLENNLTFLMQGREEAVLHAIYTSASIKGELVAQDERECSGLRSLLNFGHTLGHALEALFHYRFYRHGEAVAIGMNLAARLSTAKGWLPEKEYARVRELLVASTLPIEIKRKFEDEKLLSSLMQDKKRVGYRLKWVLLKAIGEAVLTQEVSQEDFMSLIPRAVKKKTAAGDKS